MENKLVSSEPDKQEVLNKRGQLLFYYQIIVLTVLKAGASILDTSLLMLMR